MTLKPAKSKIIKPYQRIKRAAQFTGKAIKSNVKGAIAVSLA